MTITLPDELRETLESRAKAAGFSSVDDYVEDVVSGDCEMESDVGSPGWIDANRTRLLALAQEGLKSPPIQNPERFLSELVRRIEAGAPLGDLSP